MNVVECHKLERRFGKRFALTNVSFTLAEGQFCALVGANGAGKSTLIRVLMRFLAPTDGDAKVLGQSLQIDSGLVNDHIGYVSEDLGFRLPMSLGAFATLNRQSLPRWSQEIFESTMNSLAIHPSWRYTQLSRGQRMRFAFCLALARRPKLLLLDEVGSVLDAVARTFVNQKLAEAAKAGTAVLLATNIPGEVQPAVDRVIVLKHGTIDREVVYSDFKTSHVKVRIQDPATSRPKGSVLSASSSDGGSTYILPRESLDPSLTLDRRALTTEEMVSYLMSVAAGA